MLPTLTPGARDAVLGISSAPCGVRAIRIRATFTPPGRSAIPFLEDRFRFGMDDHRHPERRRDRVDGDVVVRRPDPAGGEQIIVGGTQRVHRLGDPRLASGTTRTSASRMPCSLSQVAIRRHVLVLASAPTEFHRR